MERSIDEIGLATFRSLTLRLEQGSKPIEVLYLVLFIAVYLMVLTASTMLSDGFLA